jgi:predicted transcriptional regulator
MIENNSDIANKLEELHPTIATPSTTDLEQQVKNLIEERDNWQKWHADLEAKLADAQERRDFWLTCHDELTRNVRKAEQAFRDILAGDMDASDIVETYGEALTEHLGWQFAREVEIEISVTWRGTIELPHGVDVDDLDVDDFGIEINGHHEYESEIRSHFESYSIDER